MDAEAIIKQATDFVLRQAPSLDDVGSLTGIDPYDGHYYRGLGFNPVGANPGAMPGLEERTARQAQTLAHVASLLRLLGDPDPTTWEGDGAKAFVDRVKKLPPEYDDAAAALRALGPLVAEVRQAITAGKKQAHQLDDAAWQAKQQIVRAVADASKPEGIVDSLVRTVVPVVSVIGVALDPAVARAVHEFVETMENGVRLYVDIRGRLNDIGSRIAKLDDKVPAQKKSGVTNIPFLGDLTDLLADGSDLVDQMMNPFTKYLIDRFPSEAHLLAGFLNDTSTLLGAAALLCDLTGIGAPIGIVLGIGAILTSVGQIAIDERIYRTGAVDATGKPVVTQDEMAQEYSEFAIGLISVGTGKVAGKVAGPVGDFINEFAGFAVDKGDEIDPSDPSTLRPKILYVDPLQGYAEDKGWTGGDDPVPQLRVRRDPSLCYPGTDSGTTGKLQQLPPNVVPLPPATGQPDGDGSPYTGPPGGQPRPLANTA
ncbi:MAG: hypothetical protein V7637_3917 [Mycobacteriales bacterium]